MRAIGSRPGGAARIKKAMARNAAMAKLRSGLSPGQVYIQLYTLLSESGWSRNAVIRWSKELQTPPTPPAAIAPKAEIPESAASLRGALHRSKISLKNFGAVIKQVAALSAEEQKEVAAGYVGGHKEAFKNAVDARNAIRREFRKRREVQLVARAKSIKDKGEVW